MYSRTMYFSEMRGPGCYTGLKRSYQGLLNEMSPTLSTKNSLMASGEQTTRFQSKR